MKLPPRLLALAVALVLSALGLPAHASPVAQFATGTQALSVAGTWTVAGSVTNRYGIAQSGKTVTATRADDPTMTWTTVSGPVGTYQFQLANGDYYFTSPNGNRTAQVFVVVNSNHMTAPNLELLDPPSEPMNVQASASVDTVEVRWDPPNDDGGWTPFRYVVTASPGGTTCSPAGVELRCDLMFLKTNRPYTVTVTAENAVGISAPSPATDPVTPVDPVPSPPQAVSAVAGNGTATVSWLPPRSGGSTVVRYAATVSPGGGSCVTSGALSCQIDGLVNGRGYQVTVVATSTGGDSHPSETSNTFFPATVPASPSGVTAIGRDARIVAVWRKPSDDGGAPVTSYVATATPGGRTCTVPAPSTGCTITGLTNGQGYTVTVTALNEQGESLASKPSALVFPTAGTAPPPTPLPRPTVTLRHEARKGTLRIRWRVSGAQTVTLHWSQRKVTTRRDVPATGRKTFKVARGAVVRVRIDAVNSAGARVTQVKRYRIK